MSDENELIGSMKETIPSAVVHETVTTNVQVNPDVKQTIEALIFASDEPVSAKLIRTILEDHSGQEEGEAYHVDTAMITSAVKALNDEYERFQRPYRIVQLAGGFIFATEKKFAAWIGKLVRERARRKLSQTAIETLAIIAYKQPITKSEVEFIRGVNADYIMKALLEKNLATIVGRATTPGRPLLYGTTQQFLVHFGLNEITDLPKPREIEELLGETELEVEKRMLAEQQELNFKKGDREENKETRSKASHIPTKKSALQMPVKKEDTPALQKPKISTTTSSGTPPTEEIDQTTVMAADSSHAEKEIESPSAMTTFNEGQKGSEAKQVEIEGHSMRDAVPSPTEERGDHSISPQSAPPGEEFLHDQGKLGPRLMEPEIFVRNDDDAVAGQDVVSHVANGSISSPIEQTELRSSPEEHQKEYSSEGDERTQKGWSKWKTKIQTFFRKLFG